ncbi:glutathione S-transferase [Parachaetomium inaequale]|uniref:Glutathione S-transferase n=1 Tax=Parachaetomium inaequale TaxID=2588326 RepID=A0AAN6P4P0_9PEZI|nr:glutathione S-transferase [Parachaetomium inaequale]
MSTIDTSITPTPTGAAGRLAAAHSSPQPLTLYGSWFCPFVQRVWMVLHEKNIPHHYVEINPYKKEKHFLEMNPRGLVPTVTIELSDGKKEWLDEMYSDEKKYGGRLLPAGDGEREVFERARCRLWMNHVATRVVPGFYRLLQWTEAAEDGSSKQEKTIEEVRGEFLAAVKAFAREMLESDAGKGGPWFLGERFSLVDVMFAPWAKRLWLIDHYKPGGVGIPGKGERGEDEEVWARWDKWYEAVVERESVKATWSDEDRYIESEVGQATRKGQEFALRTARAAN